MTTFPLSARRPKAGVVLRLYRSWRLIYLPEPKDVVDGTAEAKAGMDLLLVVRRDLDELTTHLDDNFELAFGLGQPCDGLEDIARVCDNADGLFGQMQLAEVEVGLQFL